MISVVGIGDNTVDRYVDQGLMYPGGNAVNVAVHASRLGYRSAYIGCLTEDRAGTLINDSLVAENVDVSRCRLLAGESAYCDIQLIDGDRIFGQHGSGVCDQLVIDDADLDFLSGFDLVHTSIYSFLDEQLPLIKSSSKHLSYDFSSEWDVDVLSRILPYVDIALISNPVGSLEKNEAILKQAISYGPELVLITSGESGAVVFDGHKLVEQPIVKIGKTVDTLGAGDAFAACFMTGYLNGTSIPDAMRLSAQYAAESCQYHGAFGYGMKY